MLPSYLAVLASRPLDAIVSPETRRRLQLGIANTPLPELVHNDIGEVSNDPFRAALVRLMRDRTLYSEKPNAVTFLTSDIIPRLAFAAGWGSDRQLRGRCKAVFRGRLHRANGFGVRDRQGRFRAVRCQRKPRARPALWNDDCGHGAFDRMDRECRLQARLGHDPEKWTPVSEKITPYEKLSGRTFRRNLTPRWR